MKIGVIGLGLIGGTIAKTLNATHEVSAYDINQSSLDYAIEHNIIKKYYTDIKEFFRENEVFYLCIYPQNIKNFIFQNKALIPTNSVIIEISGVKYQLIKELEELYPLPFDIVYSHPVAGSEKTGVEHSKAAIFKNANYVITPIDSNKKESLELAKYLAESMGFKYISMISAKEHDDIIAYTSQLTHVLSISLVNALSSNLETRRFIGDSYRDLTRISIINDALWPDLFLYNRDSLLREISLFEEQLMQIKDALKMNDRNKLSQLMQKSSAIRNSIERG